MKSAPAAFAALIAIASPAVGLADDAADIRAALVQWTADFNARNRDSVCGLFAPDVIAEIRGAPPRDFTKVCDVLLESLGDESRTLTYGLDVKEVIVEGDLAVVRLDWTLRTMPADITTTEQGMDVFHRQPDGAWQIIRFLVHDAP
jgi:steroid delta-isomerase